MLGLPTHSYGKVDDNYQEIIAMEMRVMVILVVVKITPVISKCLLQGLAIHIIFKIITMQAMRVIIIVIVLVRNYTGHHHGRFWVGGARGGCYKVLSAQPHSF